MLRPGCVWPLSSCIHVQFRVLMRSPRRLRCSTLQDGQGAFSHHLALTASAASPLVVSLANSIDHVFRLMRRPLDTTRGGLSALNALVKQSYFNGRVAKYLTHMRAVTEAYETFFRFDSGQSGTSRRLGIVTCPPG